MSSAGHRRNMLYANHRKVNIGIARDNHSIKIVHHFESDHVTFSVLPPIEDGVLRFTGALEGYASMYPRRDWPAPYDLSPHLPPSSYGEALQVRKAARDADSTMVTFTAALPWITTSRWTSDEDGFDVVTDTGALIPVHGEGVYSI